MLKIGGGKALAVLIVEFLFHGEKIRNVPITISRQEHQQPRWQLNKYNKYIIFGLIIS